MKTDVITCLNSCVFVVLKKPKWQRRNHTGTLTGTRHPAKSSVVFLTSRSSRSWRIRRCRKLISRLREHHLQDLCWLLAFRTHGLLPWVQCPASSEPARGGALSLRTSPPTGRTWLMVIDSSEHLPQCCPYL